MISIGEERIASFFSVLPQSLKENIFIVILGNNEKILPKTIIDSSLINISPLDIDKTVSFINNGLSLKDIKISLIRKIAEKSEGNPLYLKYLIDYIKNEDVVDSELVDTIPSFNGEIENYYRIYWERIDSNRELINALAILARIRKSITKEEFIKILPLEEQYVLERTLSTVNHLLNKTSNALKIYHSSFEKFIREKTVHVDTYVHGIIANFCLVNEKERYSLENILYHLINSEDLLKREAIKRCNQSWLDLCSLENIQIELMMVDIKNVLSFSIDEGAFSEIIRLLLLLQRFKFRNDKLFKNFSVDVARALYEIGKGKYILNYITRDDSLIETISDEDIIDFLRKLTKDGFILESKKLLNAIKSKCIKEFEKPQGTSFTTFLLDVNSSILSSPEEAFFKIKSYSNFFLENYPETGEDLREILVAEPLAWMMKEFNHYADTETLKNHFGTQKNERSVNFISKIILIYIEMQDSHRFNQENEGLLKAVKDLEDLLKEYDVNKNSEAILALIQFSKETSLLKRLIDNEIEPFFSLRSENQVDFNFLQFLEYKNYWMFKGYTGYSLEGKDILLPNQWESFVVSKIKEVGIILGKCYRVKAGLDNEQFLTIYEEILKLLEDLKIRFKDRVEWERSYFIPENAFPLIYKDIAFIYTNFFGSKIEEFKKILLENYQLGLYNEGYRRILFNVAEEMVKNKGKEREAFSIVQTLEEFIDRHILNRWERNKDFLKVIELYGKMNTLEKANLVYKKMLETSMGPSWYKESQLSLMATGIEKLENLRDKECYISEILGHLQYASGEMTFQRYVRDDKEKMIGIISKNLNRKKSLEYFKKMINPSYEELLSNTKRESSDILEETQGYTQGTQEVDLQDSMMYFIKELDDTNPIVKFSLTEIFIQGDERYFEDYVNLQIETLSSIKDNLSLDYRRLMDRIKRQFIVELDEQRRTLFLEILKKQRKIKVSKEILSEVEQLNAPKAIKVDSMFDEVSFDVKERAENHIVNLAKEEIKYGNVSQVKEMLAGRLIDINKESGDIFNYSNESKECLDLLKECCESEKEFINYLKSICFQTYNSDWMLAYNFIKLSGNWLSEDVSNQTMQEVLKHIKLMIRTPQKELDKYKWIEDKTLNSEEYELERYIIWLTNLPSGLIYKKKAIEVLTWLGEVQPQTIIPLLVQNSLENIKEKSSEIAASILHVLSQTEILEYIWFYIQLNNEVQSKILKEKHFTIKSCYYEIAKVAKKKNLLKAEEYTNKLESAFFMSKEKTSKNEMDLSTYSNYLSRELMFTLKELNSNANISNEFLHNLILGLKESILPLTIEDLRKVDRILERSYSIPRGLSDDYSKKAKNEINLLISDHVTVDNYNELKEILRCYNPYFPERKYSLDVPNIYEKVKDVLEAKEGLSSDFLGYEDKLILHYNEITADKEIRKGNRIEMVAFLINNSKELPEPNDKLYDSFYANLESQEGKIDMKGYNGVFPLVYKSSFASCNNSWYTPSDIHPKAKDKYAIKTDDFERKVWKSGTILDVDGFGMPISEGSLLTIDKSWIGKIEKNYRLMYLIKYNDDEKIKMVDYHKKKIIGVVE